MTSTKEVVVFKTVQLESWVWGPTKSNMYCLENYHLGLQACLVDSSFGTLDISAEIS